MEQEMGSGLAVINRSTTGESTRKMGEMNVFNCLADREAKREVFVQ